jgi:hypothetical protein
MHQHLHRDARAGVKRTGARELPVALVEESVGGGLPLACIKEQVRPYS